LYSHHSHHNIARYLVASVPLPLLPIYCCAFSPYLASRPSQQPLSRQRDFLCTLGSHLTCLYHTTTTIRKSDHAEAKSRRIPPQWHVSIPYNGTFLFLVTSPIPEVKVGGNGFLHNCYHLQWHLTFIFRVYTWVLSIDDLSS